MGKILYDLSPFTVLDFPGKIACILWFPKCNMRCSYCYNPEIVFGEARIEEEDLLGFLDSRQGLLDGVVFSGGEATLFPEIEALMKKIKARGFAIKLDTNGSSPALLKSLLSQELLDYVSLDFKGSETKFREISCADHYGKFVSSLDLLIASDIQFEVRSTVHPELLDEVDINEMAELLKEKKYKGSYYLQNFVSTGNHIAKLSAPLRNYDKTKIIEAVPITWRG